MHLTRSMVPFTTPPIPSCRLTEVFELTFAVSSTQQHSALLSTTKQHSTALGTTKRHSTALNTTKQHSAALSTTKQHSALLSSTQQHSTGWMDQWKAKSDLCIAVGTSMAGFTCDDVPAAAARKLQLSAGLGLVIINLVRANLE